MAPAKGKSGNTGSNNPHMTKRHRFNSNCNVPVSHAGCQVSQRAKIDKERHLKEGNPTITYTSRAKGIFHVA